jgi:tetratricopeptide (TPR) repeat protein
MNRTLGVVEGTRPNFDCAVKLLGTAGLLALLLACAMATLAQQPSPQPQEGQNAIQSKAEYDAYKAALDTQDATARAEALAAFVQDYPHSVALTDALEQEMAAWQAAGDSGEVKKTAKQLLELDQGNIRALGIVVALDRVSAAQGDLAALNEMCADASGGMMAVPMWHKPAGMSDTDFVTLSKLMNAIFTGAEGFCAVQEKNYSQARQWLTRALEIDPTNAQDTYELAVADLEMSPLDADGFWYCARAIHLTQNAAIPQDASVMVKYCKAKYTKYHGADDGWGALVESSAAQDAPPKDFENQIKPGQK